MKRKKLFLSVIALFAMMALPTIALANGRETTPEVKSRKTLPYPRATKAIPASAMEFDSVADCFVVRDTITGSTSRSRAASRVETRAAVAYTEAGVQYGYYGNQLSSKYVDEMKQLLAPWVTMFKNIEIDSILSPAPGKTTWYMQIVGVDNNTIDKKNGEMHIYNDIGTSYNYKTIAIDSLGLRGNEHIKKIVFEDCASASENANTMLKMVIHDGAFKDCKNLEELNMYYLVTDGGNHNEILLPTDVYIGKNVFDGCHPDFRIVVDKQVYKMFVTDPNWSQYADMIVAAELESETIEEDGVKYGYFGYQLSSRNMETMKLLLEPWAADFRNLNIDELLTPAPNKETWYMQIVGVNNTEIDKKNGELRIYNDIGTSYNYKTIAIDSTALRGNEHIRKVVFEDAVSGIENANTRLKMVIHDGAFKECKNLKEFNMFYLATEGDNNYQMLYPTDVYIGKNVFDGCHPDFRIVVAPQLYRVFTTDANWSQYADRIVAADYLPTAYKPITFEGITYDYAANSLNTLPTSELTRLQSSWWNALIIGAEVAIAIVTSGVGTAAQTSAQTSAQAAVTAAQTALNNAVQVATTEASSIALGINNTFKTVAAAILEDFPTAIINASTLKIPLSIAQQAAITTALHNVSVASAALAAKEVALAAAMSSYTYYMMAAGISATSAAGINGLGYVANTVGKKARREPTWAMAGQWLLTECKHTIYHMYVKDVENKETVTMYNDIGSAYNYKTVAIGRDAFRGKDKVKTVKFRDVNTGEMYAPMTVLIPDSAFLGCTSLETLDLIMYSNRTSRDVPLGPENFIVCGDDIFAGCDTTKLKIRIGAEKYEEFAENPFWGKYKNCFEVVDVPENVDFTDFGAQYSYSFENNSLKKQSYTGGHTIEHVHIIGQNGDMESQQGEVGLFNDIGIYNNYKLDYVKQKAFYASKELKGISMFDLKGFAANGDAYSDLELVLKDSAFAHCPNLEYINMLYFRTDGGNTVEAMSPSRVMLEDGVFAGCDNFKVKMVTTAVDEFKADTAWAKYEEKFLPCFIETDDEILKGAFKECGMLYHSPIWKESFDIYDVTKVTAHATLDGKFKGKKFEAFREFKAFECVGLGYVGDSWFKDCDKMQGIELPSTIKSIGKQAFYNCALLDDVIIPDSVTEIQDEAFGKCAALKSITFLSATPATLGNNVFADMPADYVLYVPEAAVETYKSAWPQYENHIQTVTNKQTGIFEVTLTEPGTLAEKLGLTITGTDPLTISGNYNKYDSLKIVGPINGTDVGVIRFMGGRDVDNCEVTRARNLKYLDLYDAHIKAGGADYNQDGANDRITEDDCIDTYMFWQLDVLETLILPKSVTKIKEYAFNHCNALSRLVIGDNTKSIAKKVTHDSPELKEVILLCNEAPATDENAWWEDKTIKLFHVPNAYRQHISGSKAYYTRCDSISSPFADDALIRALAEKRIYTMFDMLDLKNVENIVNGNSEITLFNELMFAIGVSELGDHSFGGCTNLEEVAVPCNVKAISAGAFKGCTSLTKIYATCDTIPNLAADAFEDLPQEFVIYVQEDMVADYRKEWVQYANHIQSFKQQKDEVKTVTLTEAGTLGEALGLEVSMSSASDVGRISGDLMGIKALKVVGPINGKDIAVLRMLGGRDEEDCDEVALARMSYLDLYEANICTDPNNICFNRDGINDYVENDNEIPEHMFWKLDRLKTVILPRSATKIDDNAFYDCFNIETIVVGDATTYIGNDAFGKCKNLKNIVFLCNSKAELHSDAFTDPVSDQPYQVEKMYIPHSLYGSYVADREYTTHTKEFCTNFEDDAVFRAYGSHVVLTTEQLQAVTNVDGWFNYHTGVKDLTSLQLTAVDTLKASTLAPLADLQKITLPSTLSKVEDGVFAANTKLQWADFSKCENEGVITENNIGQLGVNEHALIYTPENFTATGLTNVVYGSEGNLKCDHFTISDDATYAVPRGFTAYGVDYDRLFKQGEMTTLCLPFNMEIPSGIKAYLLNSEIADTMLVAQVKSIQANLPYVIMADNDVTIATDNETFIHVAPNRLEQVSSPSFAMLGILAPISAKDAAAQRMYTLNGNDSWSLVKDAAEGEQALSQYRVYMQATRLAPAIVKMREAIYNIVDGAYTTFENPEEKIGRVTYTRTLNNTWNALYVPFQIELTEEFLADYDVAYINDVRSYDWDDDSELDGWDIEIIKIKKLGKLKANHPYVIRPKNAEAMNLNISQIATTLHSTAPDKQITLICSSVYKRYTVKGIYAKSVSSDLNNGDYIYAINKKGEWQKMGLETSLVPFRMYLTIENIDGSPLDVSESAIQSIRMHVVGEETEDGTTLIHDIEMVEKEAEDVIYDLQGRRVLEPKKGCPYIINNQKVIF